jgi:hypothetical protein
MKPTKELDDALEAVSKEVDSWPSWKRSIDLMDLKELGETSEKTEPLNERPRNKKVRPLVRAAKA